MKVAPSPRSLPAAGAGAARCGALTRERFVVAVIAVAALAGSVHDVSAAAGGAQAVAAAFAAHKLRWLCLGIACWHVLRDGAAVLRARDVVVAAPALALAGTSGGAWPWIGLAMSLAAWLHDPARGARRTALALATHEIAVDFLGELAGDALLDVDARIAALLAPWMLPALAVSGTALHAADGHTVILVWGCSSLSNLGEALLLCWALTSLHPGAGLPGGRARLACCLALLAVLTVALNATRLTLMASSPQAYAYIHDEGGAVLFRIALLGLTVIMSGICIHDASRRMVRAR